MGGCCSSQHASLADDGIPPTFRILILGSGESGKSTITKQIRRCQNGPPLTDLEKSQTQLALCHNILECLRSIVKAMQKVGPPPDRAFTNMLRTAMVEQMDESQPALPEALVHAADKFIQSEVVRTFLSLYRNRFWILDAHPYYFSNLHRIAMRPYDYTEDDFIFARVKTVGVIQTTIQIPNSFNPSLRHRFIRYEMIDVAGQRSERRKWIQYFDHVDAITFVVNLAGYATRMLEDSDTLRMHDELSLFRQTVYNPIFKDVHIFLILNKKDLFEELLRQISLRHCFPDYDGPDHDVGEALAFVSRKFKSMMPGGQTRYLTIFYMSARVRREVKCAFDDIFKHTVMEKRSGH